jgi:putative ABC transport system substrate-binding protein
MMRRREFISLLGGAATVWPLSARAQRERMRRVGMLLPLAADDSESQRRVTSFVQGLQELGWIEGRNVHIVTRWTGGDVERMRKQAAELVAVASEVILASGGTVLPSLLEATRSVPIVFTLTPDPVGGGFVESLAKPGGNATGFTTFEYGLGAKWVELLREIAPGMTRMAVLRDATLYQGIGMSAVIRGAASSLGLDSRFISMRDAEEIERGIATFAREGNGGLIVPAGGLAFVHRHLIIALAARYKLPAIYFQTFFLHDGGLISYGVDTIQEHRRAAGYVDRILRGERPADLPVQAPIKLELAINLKTAKALGIDIPPAFLARADEVIE